MTDLAALLTGPVDLVAPRLLGCRVRVDDVVVRLTEVEAYDGERDAGSHAYRGRTTRNAVMFGPAGHLYCYFSYGMHVCANVVTGTEGTASAVLLRAGAVVAGTARARERRGDRADHQLARGPANLCRTLGVGLDDDGARVVEGGSRVRLEAGGPVAPESVRRGPRVGLTGEPDRPWRYWLAGERSVSAYRRSPRATPPGAARPAPDLMRP